MSENETAKDNERAAGEIPVERVVSSRMDKRIRFGKYNIIKTCNRFPEQYEIFYGATQIGYMRLRHGHFTVECPDALDKEVYSADTIGDGEFEDIERSEHMNNGFKAIIKWFKDC